AHRGGHHRVRRGGVSLLVRRPARAILVRRVAAVRLAKLRVDGLAPGETFVGSVPEPDARLAQLPAEVHLFAAEQRGEVHQPDVEILDDAPELLNAVYRRLQTLGAR